MGFEALDMFRKMRSLHHANNSIRPMQGGILPLNHSLEAAVPVEARRCAKYSSVRR